MTETTAPDALDVLLNKVSQLIKTQTSGELTEFSTENLNHVYMSLIDGSIDEQADALLTKIAGADWANGLTKVDPEEDLNDEAKHMALVELLNQIDETKPEDAVTTLASALMVACRELGWLEASRAAHDQWFFSKDMA